MPQTSAVRIYIACSLDGFIAGANDDLSWLPQGDSPDMASNDEGALGFDAFMAGVGVLLMGRRTFDVVAAMGHNSPYGDTPILVTTHRELPTTFASASATAGTVEEVVGLAKEVADGKDVYIDGGTLIRSALDAGLVDDIIITFAPHILGEGIPLFAGASTQRALEFTGHYRYGSMIQVHARPKR